MSAFQVSGRHIAAIVGSYLALRPSYMKALSMEDAKTLAAENARSVNHRYRTTDVPVSINPAMVAKYQLEPLTPVALIKACHCLNYQSCETDDWEHTLARKILADVEAAAIRALPGYDTAQWAIDEEVPRD